MKLEFIEALLADIPGGVADFLATPIGAVDAIAVPATKEAAVIACGVLAANMNNALLAPFAGLTPIELFLRIGQKNPALISAMILGMEVIAGAGGGKLTIISPAKGSTLTDLATPFSCQGQGIASVLVTIPEWGEFELTADGDTWSGTLPDVLPDGEQTATFAATYGDGSTASASVTFTVAEAEILVATFPENETSYGTEELTQLSATIAAAAAPDVTSVNFTIFGQTITATKTTDTEYTTSLTELNVSLGDWIGLNVMEVNVEAGGKTAQKSVNFDLRGD